MTLLLLFLLRHSCFAKSDSNSLLAGLNLLGRLANIQFALFKLSHNLGDFLSAFSLLHRIQPLHCS